MLRRTLLWLVLLVLVAFYYWKQAGIPWQPAAPSSPSAAQSSPTAPTLRQLKEQRHEAYRVLPDRRFLLALAEIRNFVKAGSEALPSPRFEGGRWRITLDSGLSAEFAELSDFASALVSLRAVAAPALAAMGLKESPGDETPSAPEAGFDLTKLRLTLRDLNGQWRAGRRDAALLADAADALAHWVYLGLDEMETADVVQAKALAVLVLAQAASGQPLAEAESLIATRMGYASHGLAVAGRLPEDAPWRLYLEGKDEALFARLNAASSQDKYLMLRRLAETDRMDAWHNVLERSFGERSFPVHAVATCLLSREHFPRRHVAGYLHYLVLYHLLRESGLPVDDDPLKGSKTAHLIEAASVMLMSRYIDGLGAALVHQFDRWLGAMAGDLEGPFLDRSSFEAFYRGYFFSGLYHYGRHLLKEYNHVEAASRFAGVFAQPGQGIGGEFGLWYQTLVAAERGEADAARLAADLDKLPSFGLPPLRDTLEEALRRQPFASSQTLPILAKVVRRIDSRIAHRHFLAGVLRNDVLDLAGAERVYQSILRDDPGGDEPLRAWLADYSGDTVQLLSMAGDSHLRPDERAYALSLVPYTHGDDGAIRRAYGQLLADEPDNWDILSKYLRYLQDRREYAAILEPLRSWIDTYGESSKGFDALLAQVILSESFLALGRKQDAWEAVKDSLPSDYGPVLRQGVKALQELQHWKEAEALARHMAERYPSHLGSLLALVEVEWHVGSYREAAELLKQWPHPITSENWRWDVGSLFAETFAGRQTATKEAFAALLQAGISHWSLQQLLFEVRKLSDPETTFGLQAQLRDRSLGYVEMLVQAYQTLRQARGNEAAMNWLSPQIPPDRRNVVSMIYFGEKEYALLWDMIPRPENSDDSEYVWLCRAAAAVSGADLDSSRRSALEDHFRQPRNDFYHQLGRFLLGFVDERTIADKVLSPKQICEAAYFLGLRAKMEHRYADAADWFLVSVETGLRGNGEYRWSHSELYRWRNLGKSLAILAATDE